MHQAFMVKPIWRKPSEKQRGAIVVGLAKI